LTFIQGAASAFHFFQDIGGSGGPDERFGALIVSIDVGADGHDKCFQITEDTATQAVIGQVAKDLEVVGLARTKQQRKTRSSRLSGSSTTLPRTSVTTAEVNAGKSCPH
jgi:hypothetical protein